MTYPTPKVVGQLDFSVIVECPLCHVDIDVMDQDDSTLTVALFNNKWDNLDYELICPHCHQRVLLTNFEY